MHSTTFAACARAALLALAMLTSLVVAASALADGARPAYVYVGAPPTLEQRPKSFYVADRPGESPGFDVVVERARWRSWGRRKATARATARWCARGGACRRVRAHVVARKPHDVACPATMRIYGLLTVALTIEGERFSLHVDPPALDLC